MDLCLKKITNLHILTYITTYIFHHITAFTFSFAQLPVQPQLRREDKGCRQLCLKQTHQNPSETSPLALGEFGSRAVWSRQGQAVARHPEVFPLCLCTATRCNLLL